MKSRASLIPLSIRPLFLTIARAGIVGAGGACASEPFVDLDDDTGWQDVECVDPQQARATGLLPAGEVDSLHVYEEGLIQAHYIVETLGVGELCSGAADRAACEQQVANLKSAFPCAQLPCHFAIVGRGGQYERIDKRAQLLAVLGSIDAQADALAVAAFDGHRLCAGLKLDPRDVGAEVRTTPDDYALRITRQDCGGELYRDELTVAPDGALIRVSHAVLAPSRCIAGRPDGWHGGTAGGGRTHIGAFLAEAAQLEAASIYAFHKLTRELLALDAPEALCRAALEAMQDEIRHATEVGELARAHGSEPPRPEIEATALRSVYALALDNIGEGCVRETFGALQATYQAETAADPRVRRVMAQIAIDESRHAELAWQLQAWLEPQLSADERAQVRAERTRVLDALAADLDVGLSREEYAALGLPPPDVSATMLARLSQALFA